MNQESRPITDRRSQGARVRHRQRKTNESTSADTVEEHMLKRRKNAQHGRKRDCAKCKKMNHFANMCKTEMHQSQRGSNVHQMEEENDETDLLVDYPFDVIQSANTQDDWMVDLKINGKTLRCKLDTGAQCNVIPKVVREKLQAPLQRSNA